MNDAAVQCAQALIGATYAQQALDARHARETKIRLLFEQKKWPEEGWDEGTIELLLNDLALMDSNNFLDLTCTGNVGVGEREARVFSRMIERRYFRMGHGVGRSGELAAVQPKAAGSSLLAILANKMMLDVLWVSGIARVNACIVVPMATGMAMVLTLLALRATRPRAKYVLWPRIDQKSCLKAIVTAGFEVIVVPNMLDGDEVRTDMAALTALIESHPPEEILCVLTTTSCFAPRAPDRLPEVAVLCARLSIPHVVNNAYGLQSSKCCHLCNEGIRVGRVDAIVQSTDKNLMVPVGGAVIAGPDPALIDAVSKAYPGRASVGPSMDVFITLLEMGVSGYRKLLADRKELFGKLKAQLESVAARHGQRVLSTKNNSISLALSLQNLSAQPGGSDSDVTFLGSMLFARCISGTRVVGNATKSVCGINFKSYGAHIDDYPCPYLTAAAAIGVREEEIATFSTRLDKTMQQFARRNEASHERKVDQSAGGEGTTTGTVAGTAQAVVVSAEAVVSLAPATSAAVVAPTESASAKGLRQATGLESSEEE